MITKKINQTVCVAGLAAIVAVSAGCRSNKLSLLSDRNVIPPPYKAPQLTQSAPASGMQMPTIAVTSPAIVPASSNEQPVLPGDNVNPVFVPAGNQPAPAQPHFDTPEDLSPKTGATAKPAPSPKAAAQPVQPQPKRTYTVVKGDTLSDIAYMYMISWQDLAAENNLTDKSILKVNQKLTLPPNAAKTPRPRQQHKAAPKAAPKAASKGATPQAATSKRPLPADGVYTIVAGDNLWVLAHRYGLKSDDIKAANPNVNWDNLQIGQKINLTGKAAPAQPKQVAAPAPKPAENKAVAVPPPPKMTGNTPEPPAPVPAPAPAKPVPPPPALIQPNDAPLQPVPTVTVPQDFPEPIKPIAPQFNNPPVPAN